MIWSMMYTMMTTTISTPKMMTDWHNGECVVLDTFETGAGDVVVRWVRVGESLTLVCGVPHSHPPPNVFWTRVESDSRNKPIEMTRRISVDYDGSIPLRFTTFSLFVSISVPCSCLCLSMSLYFSLHLSASFSPISLSFYLSSLTILSVALFLSLTLFHTLVLSISVSLSVSLSLSLRLSLSSLSFYVHK